MEVLKIRPEPTRSVKVPLLTELDEGSIPSDSSADTHYYPYTIKDGEHVFPRTFAFETCGANIIDFIGAAHFSLWIIEQRRLFLNGDRVIVQMEDGRIFAGKAKILTYSSLIIRNNEGINCEVVDFSKVRFLGRLVREINA
ncbi:hypothetical protein E4665_03665 [Sporolactobacillus shoreae]|uniref:Uncharacterized protein n=1 Tax=Sporolactobacillus shoreae TaxID=1465501 RepID=A0A4Z0GT33_9BACL|nr:hypothetical protein [Sporolactobacillus shoreae]TGA99436.1 hypothetical protein E4665_03665 [Sporolactobacillus shoreae]